MHVDLVDRIYHNYKILDLNQWEEQLRAKLLSHRQRI